MHTDAQTDAGGEAPAAEMPQQKPKSTVKRDKVTYAMAALYNIVQQEPGLAAKCLFTKAKNMVPDLKIAHFRSALHKLKITRKMRMSEEGLWYRCSDLPENLAEPKPKPANRKTERWPF